MPRSLSSASVWNWVACPSSKVRLTTVGLLLVAPVTGMTTALQDFPSNPVALAMRTFVETCTIGFAAALQCTLYVALRESREGPMSDYLTEIFA